jgi:hypothetical protein
MRTLPAISSLMSASWLSMSCGSDCGLALVQRIEFSSPPAQPVCCGESVYRDVSLTNDDVQVDLTNSSPPGRVDAFLTNADCTKLFDTYAGARTGALCQILIGPVPAATVSERRSVSRGRYRIFAQALSSNELPTSFVFDLGIWSDDCRYQRQSPL